MGQRDAKKAAKAARQARLEAERAAKRGNPSAIPGAAKKSGGDGGGGEEYVQPKSFRIPQAIAENLSASGALASHPLSRDTNIINFGLIFHGRVLIDDTTLELNFGRRYGLIGQNGAGKSSLLWAIFQREIPIPEHIDMFHLSGEVAAFDESALECVMSVDEERTRIEAEVEELAAREDLGEDAELAGRLENLYDRLDAMDGAGAEKRAAEILWGLGFTPEMQKKKTREFSGGWRMRIALARALYVGPTLMLLDEPTNHLDLGACVWLENYLKTYGRILLMCCHSQDFMNEVCTNIIHLKDKKLNYYGGNYDAFVKTKAEVEENQMKQYNWEQDQMEHMKEYIRRFGHGSAKLARQAQSKQKTLDKMVRDGLTEKVSAERSLSLQFAPVGKLPPPVLAFQDVTFGYSPDKILYRNLEWGADLDSRIALVGPNGVGKSTLLKLITGDLVPLDGMVRKHGHCRLAFFHQHLTEHLDTDKTPLEFLGHMFPTNTDVEKMRSCIGRFGITGEEQLTKIGHLSDGQKRRVAFAWITWQEPHILLLDEPTNHLDMATIDALADAINAWDGGMILVSHDFRLIDQVAKEIWVAENQTLTRFEGSISAYKKHLKAQMAKEKAAILD